MGIQNPASGSGGGSPSGPAGGDLGGTYPNPTVVATHLSAPLPVAQGGTGAAAAGATAANNIGALAQASNLSDIPNVATARANLGLGTAATQSTAAFLQATNNLSDVASVTTARSNLGLGTAATQSTAAFLQPANNLSDVANAATAFATIKQAASETATSVVELATIAEAVAGTDTTRAVTAAGVAAAIAAGPSLDGTPDTDLTANGPHTNTFVSAGSTTAMDLVYLNSSSKWALTDADAAATAGSVMIALALESKTADQAMNVALPGCFIRNDAWNWTPGVPVYVSTTAGALTATAPSGTDDVIRVVGFAMTTDVIFFNPSPDYITST